MKKTRRLIVALTLLGCSCSTAGPFVTGISSDGQGNLIIEKSIVKFNAFLGTVSNEGSTTTTIKLVDPAKAQK